MPPSISSSAPNSRRVSAVGDQRRQDKSVDRLADDRHRDHRQLQDGGADVGRSRRRQRDYIQNQGGAVVGAAGSERGRNQRTGGILGSGALAQDVGDALIRQKPVHAVAAQQEAVVQRHRLRGVVEAHFRLHSQRAVERVRATRAILAHMVCGEASQAIAAQPIGARIPDVQQVGDAAAQHQRRQRATHSGELGVLATHGIDPAVERTDDLGARSLHLHGLGQIAKSVQEAAHRGLGRNATALRAADSIGDRGDHFLARLGQLSA